MGITFRRHPTTSIKLFRSLIEPILLYASDFWGILKMPANNQIENFFISFCKQLLGVHKQSTNDGVLLELGQFPLLILAKKKSHKKLGENGHQYKLQRNRKTQKTQMHI